jgi:hypothetical protein
MAVGAVGFWAGTAAGGVVWVGEGGTASVGGAGGVGNADLAAALRRAASRPGVLTLGFMMLVSHTGSSWRCAAEAAVPTPRTNAAGARIHTSLLG